MKKPAFLIFWCVLVLFFAEPAVPLTTGMDAPESKTFLGVLRATIEKYLNRPYVLGSSGLKSFDCSGFVWRVLNDSGVLIKRTTARKYYLSLPAAERDQVYQFGNVVFFDDLKHCGIVLNEKEFYHAKTSKGTTLDTFSPYWRQKIMGFRAISVPPHAKRTPERSCTGQRAIK